jgi:hypothetical protein
MVGARAQPSGQRTSLLLARMFSWINSRNRSSIACWAAVTRCSRSAGLVLSSAAWKKSRQLLTAHLAREQHPIVVPNVTKPFSCHGQPRQDPPRVTSRVVSTGNVLFFNASEVDNRQQLPPRAAGKLRKEVSAQPASKCRGRICSGNRPRRSGVAGWRRRTPSPTTPAPQGSRPVAIGSNQSRSMPKSNSRPLRPRLQRRQ